ncbi:MAG: hypothetical protein GC179_13425 [Anaerolineaceae bacterium]|nr:hypothetical protein [Anaerolineaceae bacterium]
MDIGIVTGWGICLTFVIGIILLTLWSIHQYRVQRAVYRHLLTLKEQQPDIIFSEQSVNRFAIDIINGSSTRKTRGIITLSSHEIGVYPVKFPPQAVITFSPADIRGFWRPQSYASGMNELWIHVERKREWVLVKLWLGREQMMEFIRTLKPMVEPEMVIAYRRQRPYIHYGPLLAQPAEQDIHGAWTLEPTISLYLMPRYLLILHDDAVQQMIPLEAVQQIGALRRLDAPQANGLVRFQTAEAHYAFALKDYEAFANALADAAKRTLEAPVMQKQKGKDGEWDDAD